MHIPQLRYCALLIPASVFLAFSSVASCFCQLEKRVCFECLARNNGLQMTTIRYGREDWDLKESQIKRNIPVFYSIPNEYGLRHWHSKKKAFRLVCVKQVKRLALEIHGTLKNLPRQIFWDAPLDAPGRDLADIPWPCGMTHREYLDDFQGVASMPFPHLFGPGRMRQDRGRSCWGCFFLFDGEVGNRCQLPGMRSRLWSWKGFPEHVKRCHGAKILFQRGWLDK